MLHGSPTPQPCCVVVVVVLRLELGRVWHSRAVLCLAGALLPGSSVLGQGCSEHIAERVRTSALPHSPPSSLLCAQCVGLEPWPHSYGLLPAATS